MVSPPGTLRPRSLHRPETNWLIGRAPVAFKVELAGTAQDPPSDRRRSKPVPGHSTRARRPCRTLVSRHSQTLAGILSFCHDGLGTATPSLFAIAEMICHVESSIYIPSRDLDSSVTNSGSPGIIISETLGAFLPPFTFAVTSFIL